MRFLQVGPVTPDFGGRSTGGVACHLIDLSNELIKIGHGVHIIANNISNESNTDKACLVSKNYTLRITDIAKVLILNPSVVLKTLKEIPSISKKILSLFKMAQYFKILNAYEPDVVHIHHLEYEFGVIIELLLNRKIPHVCTIHSFHSIEFRDKKASQRNHKMIMANLRRVNNLIFVSTTLMGKSKRYLEDYSANMTVISNPIEISRFTVKDKLDCKKALNLGDSKILLYIGSIESRKGYESLLRYLASRNNSDVKLIIIGSGETEKMQKNAVVLGVAPRLIHYSYINNDALCDYYNAADVFVLPSLSESFGLVYIESLLCGTPVIGTTGVPEEVIPTYDLGFRVKTGSDEELFTTIDRAINTSWDRDRMRAFASTFSWTSSIDKFTKLYGEIVEAGCE